MDIMWKRKELPDYYGFRSAFHGRGAEPYTPSTRRVYAQSLLGLADKLFWAPIAALLGFAINPHVASFFALLVLSGVMFVLGLWLRHCGLSILDHNPPSSADQDCRPEPQFPCSNSEPEAQQVAAADRQPATRAAGG